MNINETDNTLTATRDEFNTIIDKALDRKIKSMPDRTALASIEKGKTTGPNINMGATPNIAPANPFRNQSNVVASAEDREKILKTFKFFNAVATNDHGTLRTIMQTYEPEYVRVLSPQLEGTNSAGGYLV